MGKITRHIKSNKYYIFGFLVLALALLANAFPRGYVFSGGDTSQFIEIGDNLKKLFYAWEGRAIFYYAIFFLLDILGVSDSVQLSWYLGVFIVGSYISFGIFSRLVFGAGDKTRFLTSLFYALNLYTLLLFTGNLGFSYYPSLYIFIPVSVGLFIKFITTEKNIFGAWFILVILLASSGFGNVAFALSFAIFLFLIFLAFFISGIIKINSRLIVKIFGLCVFSFLISAFWLWPVIPAMKGGVEGLQNSEVLEFHYIIRHTASPIWNTISMLYFSKDHFPYNFPYASIDFLKNIFIALAFLPMAVVSYGFFSLKRIDEKNRKIFLAFGGVLLAIIILVVKIAEPFKIINHYIFSLWGMETLRGFDKTAIFLPFLLASMMLIILSQLGGKKWLKMVMIIILLIPLPFYGGKIQQNLSYRFSGASIQNKDYRKSKLSFLVKIPDEYYRIRKIINSGGKKSFIATLPYSSNDGSGISNYPKWKMYGTDITQFLYDKDMLVANKNYFPDWNFARAFNDDDNPDARWIVKLLGAMNVKYIIYHKDAPEDAVAGTQGKIKNLEKEGMIRRLEDNDYFTLYELKKDYIIPYISWQDRNILIASDVSRINSGLDEIKNNYRVLQFEEINPKKFEVRWSGNENMLGKTIIIAEQYDPNWKAYIVSKNGEEKEIKNHILARGYANGWTISQDDGKSGDIDHILVEYYPVRLMRYGIYISIATALFLLVYLVSYYYGHKKRSQKNIA